MLSINGQIGDGRLVLRNKYTHLEIVCRKKMDMKVNVTEAASQIRRIFFGLNSSSFSEQDLNPLTCKRIYETVIFPKALYGCELRWNISQTDMLLLERSHRLCLKTIHDIDRHTSTSVALSPTGSFNLQYEIDKRKANLLGQLNRLDPHFAAKPLFLHRSTTQYLFKQHKFGFVVDVCRILEDYSLGYVLTEYINSGLFPTKYSWKKLVSNKLDRVKRIWYLSPMRAAKVQASLHIRAVSPEPPLLAHTSSESRGTVRQKARSLDPLRGWACAVKICHDGMLEDTSSLDGAQLKDAGAINIGLNNNDHVLWPFCSIYSEARPCYFCELSRKHPYMLVACKSVVKMIALTFSKYQPEIICSVCGSLVTKYVDHCILWHKAQAVVTIYLQMRFVGR